MSPHRLRNLLPMPRLLRSVLVIAAAALSLPAAAQTPPTQGWPANRPPAAPPAATPPAATPPGSAAPGTKPAPGPGPSAGPVASGPVPLATWVHEIDTEK